jgi:hypothetical protein
MSELAEAEHFGIIDLVSVCLWTKRWWAVRESSTEYRVEGGEVWSRQRALLLLRCFSHCPRARAIPALLSPSPSPLNADRVGRRHHGGISPDARPRFAGECGRFSRVRQPDLPHTSASSSRGPCSSIHVALWSCWWPRGRGSGGNHTRADLVSVGMLLFPEPLWANLLYAVVWISFIFLLFNWRKGLWSCQPYFTH